MDVFKELASDVAKWIAGIAGVVLLFAPWTTKNGLEISGCALVVGIIFGGIHMWAKPEDDKAAHTD